MQIFAEKLKNKAKDAGSLTDSENNNAVMRKITQQMVKGFYLIKV